MWSQQHPENIVWFPRSARALFPWVKWCFSLRSLACGTHGTFKYPRGKTLCSAPIQFHRFEAGTTWGLHLWMADGWDRGEFFERTPLPKAWKQSLITIEAQLFSRISWYSNCPNNTLRQTDRSVNTATFAIWEGATGRCCCWHMSRQDRP